MTDKPYDELMLQAALDGELDAAGMLAFERARAASPALAMHYEQLAALRGAMRAHAGEQRAPEALRQRIAAMSMTSGAGAASPATPAANAGARSRLALVASLAGAFMLGALVAGIVTRSSTATRPDRLAMLLVDDHRRSLLAREPVDVVSTDRHTVKPWFDSRLAVSPVVVDLANQGIELAGGRADVVDGAPAPTMVYRLREHLISVTALPSSQGAAGPFGSINGYQFDAWSDGVFAYWAVSDLPRPDLDAFVAAFKAGALANEGSR